MLITGKTAPRPTMRGFTLIELLVTLAVLGIALGLALPGFQALFGNAARSEAAADLYVSLLQARSEAVARNATVSLVPVDGDWSLGWRLMVDENGDDQPDALDIDGSGTLVPGAGLIAEVQFAGRPPEWRVTPAPLPRVRFNRSGRVAEAVNFTLCGPDARRSREVSATPAGGLRLRDLRADEAAFSGECG